MSASPLLGHAVVVTRTRAQASVLVDRLVGLGAGVIELPVIAIEEPTDGGEALAAAAARLVDGRYQWVAVTSPNAASRLLSALADRAVPEGVQWAAVGEGTARLLAEGRRPAHLVAEVSVAAVLADSFPAGSGTVLFPRAETVSGALATGLRGKGWTVEEVVAYRTVAAKPEAGAVAAARQADMVAFTSSSTVDRTVELLGRTGIPPLVVTIGPVTSGAARGHGLRVAAEADPHSIDGLVAALVGVVDAPGGDPGALS